MNTAETKKPSTGLVRREEIPCGEYRLALESSPLQRAYGSGYYYLPDVMKRQGNIITSVLSGVENENQLEEPQLFTANRALLNSLKLKLWKAKKEYHLEIVRTMMKYILPVFTVLIIICNVIDFISFGEQTFLSYAPMVIFMLMIPFGRQIFRKPLEEWAADLAAIVDEESPKWSVQGRREFKRDTEIENNQTAEENEALLGKADDVGPNCDYQLELVNEDCKWIYVRFAPASNVSSEEENDNYGSIV